MSKLKICSFSLTSNFVFTKVSVCLVKKQWHAQSAQLAAWTQRETTELRRGTCRRIRHQYLLTYGQVFFLIRSPFALLICGLVRCFHYFAPLQDSGGGTLLRDAVTSPEVAPTVILLSDSTALVDACTEEGEPVAEEDLLDTLYVCDALKSTIGLEPACCTRTVPFGSGLQVSAIRRVQVHEFRKFTFLVLSRLHHKPFRFICTHPSSPLIFHGGDTNNPFTPPLWFMLCFLSIKRANIQLRCSIIENGNLSQKPSEEFHFFPL